MVRSQIKKDSQVVQCIRYKVFIVIFRISHLENKQAED